MKFDKSDGDSDLKKFAIIAYGQTGSGKTYTVTGYVWHANGLLRKCLERFAAEHKHRKKLNASMTIVQLYHSELKDLCRYYLEPYRPINVTTKNGTAYADGAKQIDISEYLLGNKITSLMKVINRALANRKTRDNATNDVSSRSILVLSIYIEDRKFTIVDLAGHERAARLEINDKRYREALFINE